MKATEALVKVLLLDLANLEAASFPFQKRVGHRFRVKILTSQIIKQKISL